MKNAFTRGEEMPTFTLETLFPAFASHEVSRRHVTLLRLCAEIGVPYPVERNKPYGSWWRALHEIGHWAVKPEWYVAYASYLMDDLQAEWGRVVIPAGSIQGIEREVVLPRMAMYQAGNDVIPQIAMHDDPTPSEMETRIWALQVLDRFGWPHPFDENIEGVTTGDTAFHKPASALVWAPFQKEEPELIRSMKRWDLNVLKSRWRPIAMPGNDSFTLPFPHPASHGEMFANMAAIREAYGMKVGGSLGEQAYWRGFIRRRWPKVDLRRRYDRARARVTTAA